MIRKNSYFICIYIYIDILLIRGSHYTDDKLLRIFAPEWNFINHLWKTERNLDTKYSPAVYRSLRAAARVPAFDEVFSKLVETALYTGRSRIPIPNLTFEWLNILKCALTCVFVWFKVLFDEVGDSHSVPKLRFRGMSLKFAWESRLCGPSIIKAIKDKISVILDQRFPTLRFQLRVHYE